MKWWHWILVILLISVALRLTKKKYTPQDGSVLENGFQILNCFTESEVEYLKQLWDAEETKKVQSFIQNNVNVLRQVHQVLGSSYVFQDYILLIKKSRIHTCHRDFNSHMYNDKQKYPSYTIIFYLEAMDKCLDVVEKSHKVDYGIFLTDETTSIPCSPGDGILFDASLIHAGSLNDKPDNKRIQMKLTHVDDVETIGFFNDYKKTLDKDNTTSSWSVSLQKHISCQFPGVSGAIKDYAKPWEKTFSTIFYGDPNFYDLKDVT